MKEVWCNHYKIKLIKCVFFLSSRFEKLYGDGSWADLDRKTKHGTGSNPEPLEFGINVILKDANCYINLSCILSYYGACIFLTTPLAPFFGILQMRKVIVMMRLMMKRIQFLREQELF